MDANNKNGNKYEMLSNKINYTSDLGKFSPIERATSRSNSHNYASKPHATTAEPRPRSMNHPASRNPPSSSSGDDSPAAAASADPAKGQCPKFTTKSL